MPEPIPESWRREVVRILRTQDERLISWTWPARQRWEADTLGAWEFEAYDALIEALETPNLAGNQTTSMPGQIATYEFLFTHNGRTMYGKIALMEGKLAILILSAHRAQRPIL